MPFHCPNVLPWGEDGRADRYEVGDSHVADKKVFRCNDKDSMGAYTEQNRTNPQNKDCGDFFFSLRKT